MISHHLSSWQRKIDLLGCVKCPLSLLLYSLTTSVLCKKVSPNALFISKHSFFHSSVEYTEDMQSVVKKRIVRINENCPYQAVCQLCLLFHCLFVIVPNTLLPRAIWSILLWAIASWLIKPSINVLGIFWSYIALCEFSLKLFLIIQCKYKLWCDRK